MKPGYVRIVFVFANIVRKSCSCFKTTIVLIEHDMGVVMDISDRIVVLDYGIKIGDGSPKDIRNNQKVIDAYLGVG